MAVHMFISSSIDDMMLTFGMILTQLSEPLFRVEPDSPWRRPRRL